MAQCSHFTAYEPLADFVDAICADRETFTGAMQNSIPTMTMVGAIKSLWGSEVQLRPLQEYHG